MAVLVTTLVLLDLKNNNNKIIVAVSFTQPYTIISQYSAEYCFLKIYMY